MKFVARAVKVTIELLECSLIFAVVYAQVLDDKNVRRRFRASNYQVSSLASDIPLNSVLLEKSVSHHFAKICQDLSNIKSLPIASISRSASCAASSTNPSFFWNCFCPWYYPIWHWQMSHVLRGVGRGDGRALYDRSRASG